MLTVFYFPKGGYYHENDSNFAYTISDSLGI